MSEAMNLVYQSIDEQHADKSAHTRRTLVKGAAAAVGGMGLLSIMPDKADARFGTPQEILNIAATAEVLATIVNTVGPEKVDLGDAVTKRNVQSAAREELVHYNVLVSSAIGGKPLTKRIWIPDAVFASRTSLLETLEVGDQIFVNAYLIATSVFGYMRKGYLARVAAEFMAVEAVHRALARQSLGKLGNDRVFMKFVQRERFNMQSPNAGTPGFVDIRTAVAQLQAAGFGFGVQGSGTPGQFYDFDTVSQRTPTDPDLNTFSPA